MREEEKKCEETMPEVYVNPAERNKIKPSKFPWNAFRAIVIIFLLGIVLVLLSIRAQISENDMIKAIILYVVSGLILLTGVALIVKNLIPYIWPGVEKFQILEEW